MDPDILRKLSNTQLIRNVEYSIENSKNSPLLCLKFKAFILTGNIRFNVHVPNSSKPSTTVTSDYFCNLCTTKCIPVLLCHTANYGPVSSRGSSALKVGIISSLLCHKIKYLYIFLKIHKIYTLDLRQMIDR